MFEDIARILRDLSQSESATKIRSRELRFRKHYLMRLYNKTQVQITKRLRNENTKHK